jgi:ankyrin repeat protein
MNPLHFRFWELGHMDRCGSRRIYKAFALLVISLSFWKSGSAARQQVDPFDAISKDHQAELAAYLDNGGNPNAVDSLGSLLEYAVRANQLGFVAALLQHGADPNVRKGASLLIAAKAGYLDITETLIAHGANVNPIDGEESPLLWAMDHDHVDVALFLLSKGTTIPVGRVALMLAVRTGSAELTSIAIAKNSPNAFDLNLNMNQGSRIPPQDMQDVMKQAWEDEPLVAQASKPEALETLLNAHFDPNAAHGLALSYASSGGVLDNVRLLLNHGADPNIGASQDGTPQVPIVRAAQEGHAEVVRALLLANADVDLVDSEGCTALLKSAIYHHDDVARYLLDAKADPNHMDRTGNTPLEYAVRANQLGFVTLLLQHGADPNVKKGAPLLVAAQAGYLDIAETLIAHGASVNPAGGKDSPLSAAVSHLDIAQFLLSKGATIPAGRAGLMWAVRTGSVELTRLALAANSVGDLSALNMAPPKQNPSSSALTEAQDDEPLVALASNPEVLEALLDVHFDPNAAHGLALARACSHGDIGIVKLLLNHGADPNLGVDYSGKPTPPIINAADYDHADVVRALLLAHADPNLADSAGNTAIMKAAENGHAEVVRALSGHADANLADAEGNTALLISSVEGYDDVAHYLLEGKADPDRPDRDGDTSLILASRYAHVDIVRYLLAAGANVNIKNKNGMTALLESAAEGSPTIISMLIARGADQRATKGNKSATDLAIANDNPEALAVLRANKPAQLQHESLPRDLELDHSQTPGEMRRYLLDSSIFRDSFLLSASSEPGQPLKLAEDQKAELNGQVHFVFDFVKQMIKERLTDIEKSTGVHPFSTDSTEIDLEDSGTAVAYTLQTAGNPSGHVVIDVKLLQAALAGSILNDSQLNFNAPSIAQSLSKILDDRREIENLAYLSHVKVKKDRDGNTSLISVDAHDTRTSKKMYRDANRVTAFLPQILPAAVQYYGILLFIVAHELGHVALGHGLRDIPCFDREMAADAFAALVLGESLAAMSIRDESLDFFNAPTKETNIVGEYLALDRNDLQSYTGFSLFFDKSYELAKFGPSSQACIYPEPTQRLQHSETIVESVASANEDPMMAKLAGRKDLQLFLDAGLVARQKVVAETSKTGRASDFAFLARVAKQLRSQGCDVLGSRLGQPDELFAENGLKKILIHVSDYQGTMENRVIKKLMDSVKPFGDDLYGIDEVWIVANSAFTSYAKALARKNRIRLIDSAELQRGVTF